jgi:transcriptional regulator with XRE-family HTH domain
MKPLNENNSKIDEYIGEKIRKYIRTGKITQIILANLLDITQTTVGKKLKGHRMFKPDELYKIACLLNCSVGEFFPPSQPLSFQKRITGTKRNPIIVKAVVGDDFIQPVKQKVYESANFSSEWSS